MPYIKLSEGMEAIVDEDEYSSLSMFRWKFNPKSGYVYRNKTRSFDGSKSGIVFMHRQIDATPKGVEIDHINLNKMDNRRSNLRRCNRQQNSRNRGSVKNSTSKYKGVYYKKNAGVFEAQIGVDGHKKYLGRFLNEKDAAKAYNKAAMEIFGEYAYINIF